MNPWDFWEETYIDPNGQRITFSDSAPSHCSNAGLGWRVSLGAVAYGDELQMGTSNNYGPTLSSPVCAAASIGQPYAIYEGPDGSQHLFYPTLHANDPDDTFNGVQDNIGAGIENVQYTRDASYLRLTRYNAKTQNEYTTIEFPDGMIHTFDASGHITQMRDRFNNQVKAPCARLAIRLTLLAGSFFHGRGGAVSAASEASRLLLVWTRFCSDHSPSSLPSLDPSKLWKRPA
jgi:hypothetical protein